MRPRAARRGRDAVHGAHVHGPQAGSRGDAVKTLQRALGGWPSTAPSGRARPPRSRRSRRPTDSARTGVVDRAVWTALENRDYPMRAYYGTVLQGRLARCCGDQPPEGVAAQGRRRVTARPPVAAVKALQGRAKLARTGVPSPPSRGRPLEAELRTPLGRPGLGPRRVTPSEPAERRGRLRARVRATARANRRPPRQPARSPAPRARSAVRSVHAATRRASPVAGQRIRMPCRRLRRSRRGRRGPARPRG